MPTTQNLAGIGWEGVVGIGLETVSGTAVTPTTIWLPVTDANPQLKNDLAQRSPVRRMKGQAQAGPGQISVSGDFTTEANPSPLGTLLGLAFGQDTVTGTASPYTHTFKMGSPLNTFTLGVDLFKGTIHRFAGCKIESIDFSSKPKGVLEVKTSIVGMNDVTTAGALSPTYTGPELPFFFEHITTATLNGVALNATQFQFTLKNNIQPAYTSGSGRVASQLNETEAVVSGSMTVQYTDESIFTLLNNCTGAPIVLTFTHPTTPYVLTLNIPNAIIETAPVSLKKKDVMAHNIKFSAFASAVSQSDDLNVVLVTTVSTSFVS